MAQRQGIFPEHEYVEEEDKFPSVSFELVESLERMYPDKAVDPRLSDVERLTLTGKILLIRFLREMHQRPVAIKD
jgi:hypothetical protein